MHNRSSNGRQFRRQRAIGQLLNRNQTENKELPNADISPKSYSLLDEIVAALIARPALKAEVEGHTDNTGSRAFNMDLSQRRAQSVVDYLAAKGVSTSRISAKGHGLDRPIADNGTKQGRSKNRRVQFTKLEEQLGMGSEMVQKSIPFVLDYAQSKGGDTVANFLKNSPLESVLCRKLPWFIVRRLPHETPAQQTSEAPLG